MQTIDISLIMCHYGGKDNILRYNALQNAMKGMELQSHLPKEAYLIEMVIEGEEAMFSQTALPDWVKYVQIVGNESNKNVFQKEALWNIGAKLSTCDKLIFADYDISPDKNIDWFYKIYRKLDECAFIQPFRYIEFYDKDNSIFRESISRVYEIINHIRYNNKNFESNIKLGTSPGGAYAMRRDFHNTINGFNEYCIVGGGDTTFFNEIMLNDSDKQHNIYTTSIYRDLSNSITEYLKQHKNLKEIGDLEGVTLYHYYHGERKSRSYTYSRLVTMLMGDVHYYFHKDDQDLMAWNDVNNFFYDIIFEKEKMNDDLQCSVQLIADKAKEKLTKYRSAKIKTKSDVSKYIKPNPEYNESSNVVIKEVKVPVETEIIKEVPVLCERVDSLEYKIDMSKEFATLKNQVETLKSLIKSVSDDRKHSGEISKMNTQADQLSLRIMHLENTLTKTINDAIDKKLSKLNVNDMSDKVSKIIADSMSNIERMIKNEFDRAQETPGTKKLDQTRIKTTIIKKK